MGMENQTSKNIKLGIFVLSGTLFLIVLLYMIGNKRNLFDKTIKIEAKFKNANGLTEGNSVRFSGINIGTVEAVNIVSDSLIQVSMRISEEVIIHIKKNSIASIGTDGLMGNKLVNILSVAEAAETIKDGDELITYRPVETTEMLKTLNVTNENIKLITEDVKKITSKVNNSNSLWNLLSDTLMGTNVKDAIFSLKAAGMKVADVSKDLSELSSGIKNGEGILGALLVDTMLHGKVKQSLVKIEILSERLANVSGDLSIITSQAKKGQSALGLFLSDTVAKKNVSNTLINIENSSRNFNENLEALKQSFLLKKYFKKKPHNK